jgi:hypothetical protein
VEQRAASDQIFTNHTFVAAVLGNHLLYAPDRFPKGVHDAPAE